VTATIVRAWPCMHFLSFLLKILETANNPSLGIHHWRRF